MTQRQTIASPSQDQHHYRRDLGSRQLQMIAIGGAIGVGLFLGAGARLQQIGPALILSYLVCGLAAFFVMRALGELAMYRTDSGSFVSYAREFVGPWAGFVSGWMFWFNWAVGGVAELTAIGIYVHKWLPNMPQWITAVVALAVLFLVNLVSVKLFGELEFWFSIIKIVAILMFLGVGLWLVVSGAHVDGHQAGPANLLAGQGLWAGLFPTGIGIALLSLQSVIFAYNGVEMVGIAAGETKQPERLIPRAVNSVAWRIGIFYCGSILLLVMILPWTMYGATESPFVLVFSKLGIPVAGDIMNLVVITAALSSTNSGLYSTGRILRSMSERHHAPRFTARMSARGVPSGAIMLTAAIYLLGVVLNYIIPASAFNIAVSVSGLGTIVTWTTFLLAHLGMRRAVERGEMSRPTFRMPFAPLSNYLTITFLLGVVVLLAFADDLASRVAFYSIPALMIAIGLGWWAVRRRAGTEGAPEVPSQCEPLVSAEKRGK
ncbi:amino acid permease [Streptomyces sp. LZ34]